MTRELRAHLAQLYYNLALAPGLDSNTADRFARMVVTLTRQESLCSAPTLIAAGVSLEANSIK
jgi:proteasome activator subunit 4